MASRLQLDNAVVATLAYRDIFDYPLQRHEIYSWCIGISIKISARELDDSLTRLVKEKKILRTVHGSEELFCLPRRQSIIQIRKRRHNVSIKKWKKVARFLPRLAWIPSLQLVGVTGGLAVNNADDADDIDIFCICTNGTVWITRFILICALEVLGIRRRPYQVDVRDTMCLNMLMDERAMTINSQERDLYAAHEIVQLIPIINKGNVYARFLRENQWAGQFLPRRIAELRHSKVKSMPAASGTITALLRLLEKPAYYLERLYMKTKITREVVSPTICRFHPHDARVWIGRELQKRLKIYNIPLDKIFHGE